MLASIKERSVSNSFLNMRFGRCIMKQGETLDERKRKSDNQSWLFHFASSLDDAMDIGLRRIRKRLGLSGIPKIQAYAGYADQTKIHLRGRVLTNPPIGSDFQEDGWWDNLTASIQRIASDEVPGVEVEAIVGDQCGTTFSDREGYFHIAIPRPTKPDSLAFWSNAQLRIVNQPRVKPEDSETECPFLTVPDEAKLMVISDVDDTILHTGATDLLTMAKLTFFGNARTRAPLDGISELYSSFQHGIQAKPLNPVFYVSSSPWNLYDLLEDFMELNAIPKGPIFLRDLGFDKDKFFKTGHDHKLFQALRLIETFPQLPVILFGDSGQDDARLYSELAQSHSEQIAAIFIRDIDPDMDSAHDLKVNNYIRLSEQAGVPMYRIQDSDEAARLATKLGLLSPKHLGDIHEETSRDRQRPDGLVEP